MRTFTFFMGKLFRKRDFRKAPLFFLVLLTALLVSCSDAEPELGYAGVSLDFGSAVPQGTSVAIPPDFAGMCHAGYTSSSPLLLDREYEMLEEMGLVWVHRDFSWSSIEPNEGDWNFTQFDNYVQRANAEGKKIMGMLLYDVDWVHDKYGFPPERRIRQEQLPHYVNYAVETVKRYNGKNGCGTVDAWLIWNEPDLNPRFWTGSKDEFYTLTKETAAAIRALDAQEATETFLIGGVFSSLASNDWINGLFSSGAMDNVDAVAFHPYGPGAGSAAGVFNGFRQKVQAYGFEDKIWVNEIGFPTYSEKGQIPNGRYGTDQYEGNMPEIAVKTFTLLAAAGARNLTWYHLFDSANRNDSNSEAWFGLVWKKSDDEWIKKGGYWGYALCARHLPGKTYKKMNFTGAAIPAEIQVYYFEGNDKSRALIVWNSDPLETFNLGISLPGSNHKLWDTETGNSINVDSVSSHILYPVNTYRNTMVFLTWDE